MERFECMRIPVKHIPQCIIDTYNLTPYIRHGSVIVEIRKGVYSLPQAGILVAYNRLIKQLATSGYFPSKHTPGLFCHAACPVTFSLIDDNFGSKYVGPEHVNHFSCASENSTQSPPTGTPPITVASPSLGTTTSELSTFPYWTISSTPSIASNLSLLDCKKLLEHSSIMLGPSTLPCLLL
jgi:hypothetical protein